MALGDFIGYPPHTQPWRPLNGMAVGQIARLLEAARRISNDDSWYTKEDHYGISIHSDGLDDGTMTFLFPNGLQNLTMQRVYRQSTALTLGGIVAEERGLAYIDMTVDVNFGIAPKKGYDTTSSRDLADDHRRVLPWFTGLSGPKWTARMLAHVFDRYHELKADSSYSHGTRMVWHDFKTGTHLTVVPMKVDVNRATSNPMAYPAKLTLRAIGDADAVPLKPGIPDLADIMGLAKKAGRVARKAVALGTDAALTLSKMAGELRHIIAIYDSVLEEVNRCVDAWKDFEKNGKRTAEMGRETAKKAAEMAEKAFGESRSSTTIPDSAKVALGSAMDAMDAMAAVGEESEEKVGTRTARQAANASSGSPPDGLPAPTMHATARDVLSYTATRPYTIVHGDTLQSIAATQLLSTAKWHHIAILNNLTAPYISSSGLPGTMGVGDKILLPTMGQESSTSSLSSKRTAEALYGRDIMLLETTGSRPGRPQVDLKIEPKSGKDLATIGGVDNLVQAVQLRVWTPHGTFLLDQGYGMPDVIGKNAVGTTESKLRAGLRRTLKRDSRIQRVLQMQSEVTDDAVDFDVNLLPVGAVDELTVSMALV